MNDNSNKFDALAKLREQFPPHQVSTLDKGRGIKLSYVGHAALTGRLLDVDPLWHWEPMAFTGDGLPMFDEAGGLWIRLTVCGMTRIGYGNAAKKSGPGDREKEVIGDALRNAAMRFGAALDLWHKGGDPHSEEPAEAGDSPAPAAPDGRNVRAKELLEMFGKATTLAEVDEVNAAIKAEWKDLKTVKGLAEAVVACRTTAQKRIGAA
jgi:hypothetical protein